MMVLAPHLRSIEDQDGAIVLDIKHNATFSLNPTTSYIWQRLAKRVPIEQIVNQVSRETGQNRIAVESDIHEFIKELKKNKMMVEAHVVPQLKHAALKAFCLLFVYDFFVPPIRILRRSSLSLIHNAVSRWRVAPVYADPESAAPICNDVEKACSWYPKRVLCLQRSVVTTYLLRQAGVNAIFVLGAQKLPFKAHAWVEVGDKVVSDKPEVVARFAVFDRC